MSVFVIALLFQSDIYIIYQFHQRILNRTINTIIYIQQHFFLLFSFYLQQCIRRYSMSYYVCDLILSKISLVYVEICHECRERLYICFYPEVDYYLYHLLHSFLLSKLPNYNMRGISIEFKFLFYLLLSLHHKALKRSKRQN